MSDIVNVRDLLLQSTIPRLIPILLPGNVTIPTSNVVGLPDYYSAAKQVVLRATTQVFKTFTVGGTTPASIIVTADLKNILGVVTFSLISGTASFTTGSNTLTINAGGMTSTSVVIQASVTFDSVVYTDQITLISTVENSGLVLGYLSNQSAVVPTLTDTTVLSYDSSGGTFTVYQGTVDVTGTAVNYSIVSSSGVNISIATTGIYTISDMTADTGTATIRAVYDGTTIDKNYIVTKAIIMGIQGEDGASGARGPGSFQRSVSGAIWSDVEAVNAISAAGSAPPVNRDIVTLYNLSINYSESKFYLDGVWYSVAAYINGNLLVTGTIASAAIATNAITADKILAGTITANKLNITGLATISTVIAGTIRTATTGGRTEISDNVIKVFDEAGTKRVQIGNLSL